MILDVAYYPPWKDKIVRVMARVLFRGKVHVIVVQGFGDTIKVKKRECSPCNGTGRMMQVDTYDVVDCPRCYGRGRSSCPV